MTCKDCEIKESAFQAISKEKKKKTRRIFLAEKFRSATIQQLFEKKKIKKVFIKIYRFKSKRIKIVNNETNAVREFWQCRRKRNQHKFERSTL